MRNKSLLALAALPALTLPVLSAHAAPPAAKSPTVQPPAAKGAARTVTSKTSALPTLTGWKYAFDEDELEQNWSWQTGLRASGPFESRIVLHYRDDKNYWLLRVSGDSKSAAVRFWRVVNGKLEKWGEPDVVLHAPAGKNLDGQLTIQRSPWRARVLWNGRTAVSAFGSAEGEQFGLASKGAVKLADSRMQPTEPAFLSDDFMRAEGPDAKEAPGAWQHIAGVWKTSGLLGPRADSSLNPNPFVFRAEAPAAAKDVVSPVTAAGKWFWSDYTVTASLRPTLKSDTAALVAGLAAYQQTSGESVIGEVDFRTGIATLRSGSRVLARSKPFDAAPGQWHRFFLDPGPGTMRLIVDGVERVRAATPAALTPAQGRAVLRASLSGGNYVDFDDVRVAPNDAIYDDFRTAAVGRWTDAHGEWQTRPATSGAQGTRLNITNGASMTLTGTNEREEGLIEATFTTKNSAKTTPAIGAVFAARDAKNYFIVRRRVGRLEIVEFANGTGKILASDKVSAANPASIAVEWREGIITGHSGDTAITTTVATLPAGRVGAWADGARGSVALQSFRAMGAAPGWGEGALPERFQKDRLMKYWASNAAAWRSDGSGTWWHTGDFFNDAALSVPLPDVPERGKLELILSADPARATSGSRLLVSHEHDNLKFALLQANKEVSATTVPVASIGEAKDNARTLRFVRRPLDAGHSVLRVALGSKVLLNSTASDNESGYKVGVRPSDGSGASPNAPTKTKVTLTTAEKDNRPYMGVEIAPVTEDVQREYKLSSTQGVFVQRVEGNSPAAKAGIQDGDVIASLRTISTAGGGKADEKDKRIESVDDLLSTIGGGKAGATLEMEVLRKATIPLKLDFENVQATTSHVLDYTFTGAPVDWNANRGRWEVAERWTCSPQWAFFKGGDAVNPTLWSRFAVKGDFTLEAYLATPMDQTRGERSPTDLNVTVGGDGYDLASGYSFLFGAKGRSVNRVMRGEAVALESPFQLPAGAGSTHQDWFYVRLERRQTPQGLRFRYSVNNRLIADYVDGDPMAGALKNPGRIAFWTYNGALSIARVRLWNTDIQSARDSDFAAQVTLASTAGDAANLQNTLGTWQPRRDTDNDFSARLQTVSDDGHNALKIVNPQSGGDWTVFVTKQKFDATQHPLVKFGYRVSDKVLVNLYAKIDGRWREILFTGDEARLAARGRRGWRNNRRERQNRGAAILPGAAPLAPGEFDPTLTIGRVEGVQTDDKWHTAQFDLLAALRNAKLPTQVEALAFAAPDRDYLRCGLGGNHYGATYWLSDFEAVAAPATNATRTAATPHN